MTKTCHIADTRLRCSLVMQQTHLQNNDSVSMIHVHVTGTWHGCCLASNNSAKLTTFIQPHSSLDCVVATTTVTHSQLCHSIAMSYTSAYCQEQTPAEEYRARSQNSGNTTQTKAMYIASQFLYMWSKLQIIQKLHGRIMSSTANHSTSRMCASRARIQALYRRDIRKALVNAALSWAASV